MRLGEPTTADSGNVEVDLTELLVSTARDAQAAETSVSIMIDNVQYLVEDELQRLIVILHRTAEKNLQFNLFICVVPPGCSVANEMLL